MNTNELRKLANRAIQECMYSDFYAAASPDAVIALLDEIDRLHTEAVAADIRIANDALVIAGLTAELEKHCGCEFDGDENTKQCTLHNAWAETLHEQAGYRRERDALARCKLADQDAYIAMRDKRDELQAKLAALEKQEPVDAIAVDDMSDGYGKRYGRVLVATENCIKPLYAAAGAAPNAWKDAILDVMTIYGMDAPTTDAPEKIIKDLIELATRVAIDPTIAAGAAPAPMELVLTFNFGTLVKAEFQDRILYEVDLSPKSYFEVCWAHGWAGDYETEEDAENECLGLCGYSRSIREVKPEDAGYKNPRQLKLTERRIPIYATAGAAPVPVHEGWQLVPIEPTDAMLVSARDWSYAKYGKPIGNTAAVGCWEAMLSAAPKDARTKETK